MVQIERANTTKEIWRDYFIRSVLSGGGSVPKAHVTPSVWVDMINNFQNGSLSSRLRIPMTYGIDVVHGHNNVYTATIFPHNTGLGANRCVYIMLLLILNLLINLFTFSMPYY